MPTGRLASVKRWKGQAAAGMPPQASARTRSNINFGLPKDMNERSRLDGKNISSGSSDIASRRSFYERRPSPFSRSVARASSSATGCPVRTRVGEAACHFHSTFTKWRAVPLEDWRSSIDDQGACAPSRIVHAPGTDCCMAASRNQHPGEHPGHCRGAGPQRNLDVAAPPGGVHLGRNGPAEVVDAVAGRAQIRCVVHALVSHSCGAPRKHGF